MKEKFRFYRQLDYMDCGPACLKMVAAFYGREYSLDYLREISGISKKGVSFLGLSEAAEKIGLKTEGVKLTRDQLIREVTFPCVIHWNNKHFIVLYAVKTKRKGLFGKRTVIFRIGDPAHGLIYVEESFFMSSWLMKDSRGVALLVEPRPDFLTCNNGGQQAYNGGFRFLLSYIRPYRKYIVQILLGMLLSSLLSLALPLLTQGLVDEGIRKQDVPFVYLILISQLLLFVGSAVIDMTRNWILLQINIRVSVRIISNFLTKLMRLHLRYFESKNLGDITQRINDHEKIEQFLTGTTLGTIFSLINIVVFSAVLAYYNLTILVVFLTGSGLSAWWILLFLKKRRLLNYARFQYMRENQNKILELVSGMSEIKLNNCERSKRWDWERVQAKLFKISARSLVLEQTQSIGFNILSQIKNIVISFLAALAVIHGKITLGMMLSISYIVGQMNGPLIQLIEFIRSVQDARISFDRLSEIHRRPDEEVPDGIALPEDPVPEASRGIVLQNVTFQYGGRTSPKVLKNIDLFIPEGKVTAIVGSSGSGKTTLLKLLLKFYTPQEGSIHVNGIDLEDLSTAEWRKLCGSVMQDGYLFSDTIAGNVIMDTAEEAADPLKLEHALKVA
ncbi:MAG TPA: cysteine peptidase family C39 domain-containing protein, partial [Puia sp.]|nr:cysteine peptidase family C39 domain-containing protein [Puia sp.]